jgi:hypothetical protein
MRSYRAFDTALNVNEAQEYASKEGGGETVNIVHHRKEQR